MKTLMFVCTGNTCRSSMAEALFKNMLDKVGMEKSIKVISAGTSTVEGQSASAYAIEIMKEMAIDLSKHRTTPLTNGIIDKTDIILTMTLSHKRDVLRINPESQRKVFTIKEFLQDEKEFENFQRKLNIAYYKLQRKRENIIHEHDDELEGLKQKNYILNKKIVDMQNEIDTWEQRLGRLIDEEKNEIKILKGKIPDMDISDPYGQPIEVYRECAYELKDNLERVLEKLKSYFKEG